MADAPLSRRQKHVLVALLEAERDQAPSRIANALGFRLGPYGHGNGAMRGSTSGFKGQGQWVTSALHGLEKRGLVRRYYADALGHADSFMTVQLLPDGEATARSLVGAGWTAVEVRDESDLMNHSQIISLPEPGRNR